MPGVGIMKLVLALLVGLAAAQFEERVVVNFKLVSLCVQEVVTHFML